MVVAPPAGMKRHWDRMARRDPMYFVVTRPGQTPAEFFASGRRFARLVGDWVGPGAGRRRMLDLGCGLGRTAVAFAEHYEHVDAVDISPEMIERARALDPPANVRFTAGNGADLKPLGDARYDLAVCILVFQHIPDDAVVGSYLAEIARVLVADGRVVVQFDSRPAGLMSCLYERLPTVLPRGTHGRYIRRYRRTTARIHRLIENAGLTILDERQPGTANHLLLLGKGHRS